MTSRRVHLALAASGLLVGAAVAVPWQFSRPFPRHVTVDVEGVWETYEFRKLGRFSDRLLSMRRPDGTEVDGIPRVVFRNERGARMTLAENSEVVLNDPPVVLFRKPQALWFQAVWNYPVGRFTAADMGIYSVGRHAEPADGWTRFELTSMAPE